MTRFYEFSLSKPGLEGVRFLVWRKDLPSNGDLESAFLDEVCDLVRHSCGATIGDLLEQAAQISEQIVVIRNPKLVLDAGLPDRLVKALSGLEIVEPWALAGSGGLGTSEQRHIALYASEEPAVPEYAGLQPLIDLMPDLYIVNSLFLQEQERDAYAQFNVALETVLASHGYLKGYASVFVPELTAGIDGALMTRDMVKVVSELTEAFGEHLPGQKIDTLSGPVLIPRDSGSAHIACDLEEAVEKEISARSHVPSLSIVTRTRFQRMHLLRRMLASISRARSEHFSIEIVLSTDLDNETARQHVEILQRENLNLDLTLRHNLPNGHSRVDNLVGGVRAASGEYILFLDDDDYLDLFAFETLRSAFFARNRPLVALSSDVHEERWEETPSGRWILSESRPLNSYPSSGWRDMFAGTNRLPICGLMIPRDRLVMRLSEFDLRHDLSEDYALFLLVLTDAALPAIHECSAPVAHISIRDSENSVLMSDRRPWVRDILAFLTDLTQAQSVASTGHWDMLRRSGPDERADLSESLVALQELLERRNQEIRLMQHEIRHLRVVQDAAQETAA
ncbi:MAG: glycosyltransferase [Pseudomonadota bacterium]